MEAATGTGTAADSSSGSQSPKEQTQEAAGNAAAKAQEAVRSQVDERSTQAGEQVKSMAGDLRSVSEQLREQDNSAGAKIADGVAERAEKVGGYLQDADADRILGDVEDFGRRQPWLALAGGIALGAVAARFLKASSSSRYQASQAGAPRPATPTPAPPAGGTLGTGVPPAPPPMQRPAPVPPGTTAGQPATPPPVTPAL